MTETASTKQRTTRTETHDLRIASSAAYELPARRFALLLFINQKVQLRLLEPGDVVVIGREPSAELVVDDPSISRQHARFSNDQGEIWLEDLDSRNGTLLGGKAIRKAQLGPGDEVRVGCARVVLAATKSAVTGQASIATDDELVVRSPAMRRLYDEVARVAPVNLPALILGETGVGKEHVARALHQQGERRDKPFVAINCATIPPTLLESTLFGHERGAFTGATQRAPGMFERAHGGVLFLDEIGDLALGPQAALLRVLETRRLSRVGGSQEIPVDVRLVAATHCDLAAMVDEGSFRRDLYFRLNGIALEVPPLRERREEIPALVQLFLRKARSDWNARAETITPEALAALCAYAWPGNVRQLRYAVERASLVAQGIAVQVGDLPQYLASSPADAERAPPQSVERLALREELQRYERLLIDEALRQAGGNREVAAKLLRIPLRTLFRKLRGSRGEPHARAES